MNLAISSLVIFLLVSPGILARRFYYTKKLSRNFISRNTLQEIFSAIFISAIFHAFWVKISTLYSGLTVHYILLLKLFFSPDKIGNDEFKPITDFTEQIFKYFITLSLASIILGILARKIIRECSLDKKSLFFRYDNKWHYLVSAEVLDIRELNFWKKTQPDLLSRNIGSIRINLTLKSDAKCSYEGLLADYQLADNNSLDYIVLAQAKKTTSHILWDKTQNKPVKNDKGDIEYRYEHEENSHHFSVIPYTDILNLAFTYISEPRQTRIQKIKEAWKILVNKITKPKQTHRSQENT